MQSTEELPVSPRELQKGKQQEQPPTENFKRVLCYRNFFGIIILLVYYFTSSGEKVTERLNGDFR